MIDDKGKIVACINEERIKRVKKCSDFPPLSILECLKIGGKLGLWIYPKNKSFFGFIFSLIRFITKNSNDIIKLRIADLIVPFLYFLKTRSGLNLSNATYYECREVVMVNIAPEELFFFNKEEIIKWCIDNNLKIDFEDDKYPITIWGTKL